MYKLIGFDMDDTLSPAKNKADSEMISLLEKLLKKYKILITTWWMFKNIENQILSNFSQSVNLENLFLFPTNASKMFQYVDWKWIEDYALDLENTEIELITNVLNKAIVDLDLKPENTWGEIVENRGSQVTYSALGQQAPLEAKREWDQNKKIRQKIRDYIKDDLEKFDVAVCWTTSIDIMKKWIDKSYAIYEMMKRYNIDKTEIFYIADALFEWWNDYVVKSTWVDTKQVENPENTKIIIKELI